MGSADQATAAVERRILLLLRVRRMLGRAKRIRRFQGGETVHAGREGRVHSLAFTLAGTGETGPCLGPIVPRRSVRRCQRDLSAMRTPWFRTSTSATRP